MSIHARPEPTGAPQPPTVHELLITAQKHQQDVHELLKRLVCELERGSRPGELRTITLGSTAGPGAGALLTVTDQEDPPSASLGILNPGACTVFAGMGGTPARKGQGAITVPPHTVHVLPVAVGDVELGIDPGDAGLASGNVTVHLIRFRSVQPLFAAVLQ